MGLPLPVVPRRCGHADCLYPEGGRCALRHESPDVDCDQLVRAPSRPPAEVEANDAPAPSAYVEANPAPWEGIHLLDGRLGSLTDHALPHLIAVLGPRNAGKTSLLAAFFLELANGQAESLGYRFASSHTLLAFDRLVMRANAWDGTSDASVVDHTDRTPQARFLHLGFRPERANSEGSTLERRHLDVLLSDISGEAVMEWSRHTQGPDAPTLGFVQRAEALLVVVDAQRLASPEGRGYDAQLGGVIRQLANVMTRRPTGQHVALVFSKVDLVADGIAKAGDESVPYDEGRWTTLLRNGGIRAAMRSLGERGVSRSAHAVSAFGRSMRAGQGVGVLAPFAHAIRHCDRAEPLARPVWEITRDTHPFVAMASMRRGWE